MRATLKNSIAASFILCGFQGIAFSTECIATSGANTTPLLELYTSEGCSSCPPADRWLSGLKNKNLNVTPLAFHVDYWDYIGWKDPFAKAAYSDRQRKVAAFGGAGFVYTPQFVLNGRDFRSWSNSRLIEGIEKNQKVASRANLKLEATPEADGSITLKANAELTTATNVKKTDVFVALYENNLSNKVNAGENNGSDLHHDYVVRELFGAYQFNDQRRLSQNFTLGPQWKNREGGAVIFAQDVSSGEIIQSLQLGLCH